LLVHVFYETTGKATP